MQVCLSIYSKRWRVTRLLVLRSEGLYDNNGWNVKCWFSLARQRQLNSCNAAAERCVAGSRDIAATQRRTRSLRYELLSLIKSTRSPTRLIFWASLERNLT